MNDWRWVWGSIVRCWTLMWAILTILTFIAGARANFLPKSSSQLHHTHQIFLIYQHRILLKKFSQLCIRQTIKAFNIFPFLLYLFLDPNPFNSIQKPRRKFQSCWEWQGMTNVWPMTRLKLGISQSSWSKPFSKGVFVIVIVFLLVNSCLLITLQMSQRSQVSGEAERNLVERNPWISLQTYLYICEVVWQMG